MRCLPRGRRQPAQGAEIKHVARTSGRRRVTRLGLFGYVARRQPEVPATSVLLACCAASGDTPQPGWRRPSGKRLDNPSPNTPIAITKDMCIIKYNLHANAHRPILRQWAQRLDCSSRRWSLKGRRVRRMNRQRHDERPQPFAAAPYSSAMLRTKLPTKYSNMQLIKQVTKKRLLKCAIWCRSLHRQRERNGWKDA